MIKEAMEYIAKLAKPETYTIAGRNYTSAVLHPVLEPEVTAIKLHTLTSLAEYLLKNEDSIINYAANPRNVMVHVAGPRVVRIISTLIQPYLQRRVFVIAEKDECKFDFGHYYDPETFIIALQTYFTENETREKILKLAGNITAGDVRNISDDGITQEVSAKSGVTIKSSEKVPNPVTLAPYRTFLEVAQPESLFVLRVKNNPGSCPYLALFEADGGKWENDAVLSIKEWIGTHIGNSEIGINNLTILA